jgi:hypothetical protein
MQWQMPNVEAARRRLRKGASIMDRQINVRTQAGNKYSMRRTRRSRLLKALLTIIGCLTAALVSDAQTVNGPTANSSGAEQANSDEGGSKAPCKALIQELYSLRRDVAEWRLELRNERVNRLDTLLEQIRTERLRISNETQAVTQQITALDTQLGTAAAGSEQRLMLEAEKAMLTGPNLERLKTAQGALDRQETDLQTQLRTEQERVDLLQRFLQRLGSYHTDHQ